LEQEIQYACSFAGRKNKPENEGESMQRVLLLSASVVAMTWAANAVADSPNLKGAYGFTGTAACLVAPGSAATAPAPGNTTPLANSGFQPNLHPVDGKVFSHSFSVEGIRTFDGNGNGTVKGTSVGITPPPTPPSPGYPAFPPGAGSSDFSFSFTYTVNGDGSWTGTMVPGSYLAHHLTGPRTGQTSTVDAIPPVTGLISQDGKTLIAAHITTAVETVTYSNGDVWPQICHRSRVFISLDKGKGGKDD
jgi:hypothetical protein